MLTLSSHKIQPHSVPSPNNVKNFSQPCPNNLIKSFLETSYNISIYAALALALLIQTQKQSFVQKFTYKMTIRTGNKDHIHMRTCMCVSTLQNLFVTTVDTLTTGV